MAAVLVLGSLVVAAAPVGATVTGSVGWAPYRGHYVRWHSAMRAPTRLDRPTAWLVWGRLRAAAIRRAKRANDRWSRELALIEQAKRIIAATRALLPPPNVSPGCAQGIVHDLIVADFGSAAAGALAIASRESGCNWLAHNPSGAAGAFQLMPFWWNGQNSFGWVFDPYNAAENVRHAKLIYDYEGGWCPAWC